jgi:hypothetical protein
VLFWGALVPRLCFCLAFSPCWPYRCNGKARNLSNPPFHSSHKTMSDIPAGQTCCEPLRSASSTFRPEAGLHVSLFKPPGRWALFGLVSSRQVPWSVLFWFMPQTRCALRRLAWVSKGLAHDVCLSKLLKDKFSSKASEVLLTREAP